MIDNEKIMQNITVYAVGQLHSNCVCFFNYLLQHQYGSRLLICKIYFCSNLLFLANLYSLIVTKFTLTLYFPVIYVFRINSTLCHCERLALKANGKGHQNNTVNMESWALTEHQQSHCWCLHDNQKCDCFLISYQFTYTLVIHNKGMTGYRADVLACN